MSNDLKDIVQKLCGYSEYDGWEVHNAQRTEDGKWALIIDRIKLPEVPKEEAEDK